MFAMPRFLTFVFVATLFGACGCAYTQKSGRLPPSRPAQQQLTKAQVLSTLQVYKTAWEQQDSELIQTIFADGAVYHERVFQQPIRGRDGIREYWTQKVVNEQARITFRLLSTYIDGPTAIAEWEVQFDDLVKRKRKHMKEVAILEFIDGKIASLREYWASEDIADL